MDEHIDFMKDAICLTHILSWSSHSSARPLLTPPPKKFKSPRSLLSYSCQFISRAIQPHLYPFTRCCWIPSSKNFTIFSPLHHHHQCLSSGGKRLIHQAALHNELLLARLCVPKSNFCSHNSISSSSHRL